MLSTDQLSIIIAALKEMIDRRRHSLSATGRARGIDLLQSIQTELRYQQLASPLIEEHNRILTSPTLSPADEARLNEINRELAALSVDRPSEFSGRFSTDDAGAVAAAKAIGTP
jgi:hypothetical protein